MSLEVEAIQALQHSDFPGGGLSIQQTSPGSDFQVGNWVGAEAIPAASRRQIEEPFPDVLENIREWRSIEFVGPVPRLPFDVQELFADRDAILPLLGESEFVFRVGGKGGLRYSKKRVWSPKAASTWRRIQA